MRALEVSDILLIIIASLFFLFCTGYLCIIVYVIRKIDRRHREYLFLDSSEVFEDLRTRSEDEAGRLPSDNEGMQYVPSD